MNYKQRKNSNEALLDANKDKRSLDFQINQELMEAPKECTGDIHDNQNNNSSFNDVASQPEFSSTLVSVAESNKVVDMDGHNDLRATIAENKPGLKGNEETTMRGASMLT